MFTDEQLAQFKALMREENEASEARLEAKIKGSEERLEIKIKDSEARVVAKVEAEADAVSELISESMRGHNDHEERITMLEEEAGLLPRKH